MHDRIQRALDGELPADGLTPDERAELHRYRAIVGTALEPIRQLPRIDVATDIVHRLPTPRVARRPLAGALAWLWSPHAVTVRPAVALIGALAIAAVISLPVLQSAIPVTSPAAPERVLVQFRLGDADAQEVTLVGDFNGWRPGQQLHQVAAGVWSVDVALEPGVYNYVFVVDGESMRLDPLAPRVTDGFGGASSRVAVLALEARS